MKNKRWIIILRKIQYEWNYLVRKFQFLQIIIFLLYLIPVFITGWGDTQSFFTGDNSPIPKQWIYLKNRQNILIISIIILAIPTYLTFDVKKKETTELLQIVEQNVVPGINLALDKLSTKIKDRFGLTGNIRMSLWIPVKKGQFIWKLEMVCRTNNIPDKELKELSFRLDEGVIGYTYLKSQRKYTLEFIDISDPKNLPSSYTPLQSDNELLINPSIKAVLAVAALQKNSIVGLLAIDTDEIADLPMMNDKNLHSDIFDWIVDNSSVVELFWRMKNNV